MSLKKLKLEMQISKQIAAKHELLYKIEAAKADIKRLQEHIDLQDKEIEKLEEELLKEE